MSDNDLISDRYQLGGLLGSGASASVFSATDVVTGDTVALKILHPQFSQTIALREAFLEEARVTAGVRHANLSGILGFGIHDPRQQNRAWIAMDFAAGVSLAEYVDTVGVPSPAEALAVIDGVLAALSAIHDAGLVHRDVTPNNVMVAVGSDGLLSTERTRLIDFGLVDVAGASALGAHVLRRAAPLKPGDQAVVIGSVNYISPEQARGNGVDARGDFYQVGCILYFALTGEPPFPAHSQEETLQAHAVLPPPVPSVLRPLVSPAIDRIVVRAMLKAPVSRFGTAADFRASIHAAQVALARSAEVTHDLESAATRVMSRTSVADDSNRTALITPPPRYLRGVDGGARGGAGIGGGSAHGISANGVSGISARDRPRSSRPFWLVLVPTLLVAVVAVSLISAGAGSSAVPGIASTSRSTSLATEAAVPTTAGTPLFIAVPLVTGSQGAAAKTLLTRSGLSVGDDRRQDSPLAADTVMSSVPAAGEHVAPGSLVTLTCASGSNAIPTVIGLTQGDAIAALQAAGFAVVITTNSTPGGQASRVMQSQPGAGASLKLGTSVTVVMAPAGPTTPATPVPTTSPTANPPSTDAQTAPPTSNPAP